MDTWQGPTYGVVVRQRQVMHWRSFQHSSAGWDSQRLLSLWKIVEHDQSETLLVTFDKMAMHGEWKIAMNTYGMIDRLKIKFHWTAQNDKAHWHVFKQVPSTDSWVCRSRDDRFAQYTQWLIAFNNVAQSIPAAPNDLNGRQPVRWRSFMHSAADWNEERSLSLWKVMSSNGQEQNFVTFAGHMLHGQWCLIINHDGVVEKMMIKFHWQADDAKAQWHLFEPEANTNSWVCRSRQARSTMWLVALADVQEVL